MEPRNIPASEVRHLITLEAQVGALMVQALLVRATALARRGRYDSAELVLTRVPRDLPEGLDLFARIRAQQGRMSDAVELWTKALDLDPGNPSFRDGLRKAERHPWGPRIRLLLAFAATIVLVVGAGFGLSQVA